ncbi:hypothetical protein A1O3_10374 [Capronia epimyces CBS 606.96]|uniref:SET domain-containing protein n=1 Tax=Capronia epimyces CBS 606.96 TaxID=1182542 RepID=W9XJR6_9EURO|nr:uncharacterized protein A1O3_10374 [Capronia epimyces CBS 606.96]EXJ77216.1 hypothetical protein A1O3_10374 [Capronia epimyces CBS 606.96]
MRQASLPAENLQAWSHFNNVELFDTSIEAHIFTEDGVDQGGGLRAKAHHGEGEPLVAVPLDLVLSKDRVAQCAKSDPRLKELIEAAASLFQTPRTAVLLFLVYQMTINSPDNQDPGLKLKTPFADYVQCLPKDIPLPTFYTPEERGLLSGTTLADALYQKSINLEREFDRLKEATDTIPWCQRVWWDEHTGCLDLGDWKLADAVYRSRAMELPRGAGVGMVPVVDMANHAADDRYNARFEVDDNAGTFLLVVRDAKSINDGDAKSINDGDEVTIMYGAGGACEMAFSYGFIEEHASSAREMFLSLSIPADDPLRLAKIRFAQEAPGVRIYVDKSDQVHWDSTFVWWACVNQEDGLEFQVEKTVDGDTELKASWRDAGLSADALHSKVLQDDLRDIFVLRAVVMIQQRVEDQGMQLAASEEDYDDTVPDEHNIRRPVYETIGRLRRLELDLLTRAYETLEAEKAKLLESATVRTYLERQMHSGVDPTGKYPEDDFS